MKTPRLPVLTVLLLLGLALTGCSSDDNPAAPAAGAHNASTTDGGLQLTVGTDKASYAFGEDVVVTMVLRNTGNAPIALDFQRGDPARYPNLSVNIRSDDNYSHFVDGDGTRDKTSLGAGESIRTTLLWEQQISRSNRQPVARGTYRVVGFIDFDDRDQLKVEDLFIELK
ncbi:hypothetical protein KDM41_04165 [bacterium]|nr:hypothetical protein [bacterium]